MTIDQEKAAGVLDTSATASKGICTAIVAPEHPDEKTFATVAARFAIRGHALHRSHRADEGRVTYIASRWGYSVTFSHWNDVLAFLVQIGGKA